LDGIRQAVDYLAGHSLMTVQRLLVKLNLRYKRGRRYVHSPDPDYDRKLRAIAQVTAQVQADPSGINLWSGFDYWMVTPNCCRGWS
jgi:hypothetical protein